MTENTMSVRVERVDPKRAEELLGRNTHNRNVRGRQITSMAADMRAGKWRLNGEALKFANDGTLLDGQHRLLAVIESGAEIEILVVRGMPRAFQETMDAGSRRTFADVLKLRGETGYSTLATVVRAVNHFEHTGTVAAGRYQPTTAQLAATLEEYPWLRDSIRTVANSARHGNLPIRVGGLLWWMFTQLDAEDAEHFFERFMSLEGHEKGDPIFEFRKIAIGETKTAQARNARVLCALGIKAWNKYREGEKVSQLRFIPGGSNAEKFPVAQ